MTTDELLDGRTIDAFAISGPKPPSPVSAHRMPPPTVFRPTPPVDAAAVANLRVLQRALSGSARVVAELFNRNGDEAA